MTEQQTARGLVGALGVVLLLAVGCTGSDDEQEPASDATSAPATPTEAAEPPAPPAEGACYRLSFQEALAPTTRSKPTPCGRPHTTETYAVGRLDLVVDGHLLAVDSDRAQRQVAEACPAALGRFLGGDLAAQRLSMIRPVWFTPTVAASDRGADWYRCDVTVIAGNERLAEVSGSLRGVLGRPADASRYAMCGTTAPDDADFERVLCADEHAWRAISVVELPDGKYPGEAAVQDAGSVCEDRGLEVADDPLDYEWGYEWPTAEQWAEGMTFGRCWAPD